METNDFIIKFQEKGNQILYHIEDLLSNMSTESTNHLF